MAKSKQQLSLSQSAIYQIRVPGRLDESWMDSFEGMTVTVHKDSGGLMVTTLTGTLADQAALHGLLRQLYALGLPLLSVNRIEGDPEEGLWRLV